MKWVSARARGGRVLVLVISNALTALLGVSCGGDCGPIASCPATLRITTLQDTVAGATFTVVVTAKDKFDRTATDFADSVTLTIASDSGLTTLVDTAEAVSGVATFSGLNLTRATAYAVTATSGSLSTQGAGGLLIRPAAARRLECKEFSDTQVVNERFLLAVSGVDSFANVATRFTESVTVTLDANPGGATFAPITSPASAGVATFMLVIDQVARGYVLVASAAGLRPDTCPSFVVTPPAGHKTWTGGAASDAVNWSNPANWLPAAVPSAIDTVVIPVQLNEPVLSADAYTGPLTVHMGASVITSGFTLSVEGNLDATGPVTGTGVVVLTNPGGTLRGTVPNLRIGVPVSLAGNTVTFGGLIISGPGGELSLNGHPLAVIRDLVVGAGAKLALRHPADTLRVYQNFSIQDGSLIMMGAGALLDVGESVGFTGETDDTLMAGVLRLGGDFSQVCNTGSCPKSFAAGGSHTVIFHGGAQRISFDTSSSAHFNDIQFAAANSILFTTKATIVGTVQLTGAGVVNAGPLDTIAIGGDLETTCVPCWRVTNTVFTDSPYLPSGLITNVIFTGQAQLHNDLTVTGNLAVVGNAAELDLNGHHLSVSGDVWIAEGILALRSPGDFLSVSGSLGDSAGAVVMTADAARLEAKAHVSFEANTHDTLTAGELRLGGDFGQSCNDGLCDGSFPATGTHRVVFDGPDTQRVSFDSPGTARFQDVEFSNATEVRFMTNAVIAGSATITGDNIVTSPPDVTVTLCGSLIDPGGDWRVAHTVPCGELAIGFITVSAGDYHTCGLTSDSLAYCWGDGSQGQLGNGQSGQLYLETTPRAVSGGNRFATISAGSDFTCAVTSGGQAYCWGGNGHGQLGDGSTAAHATPVPVSGGHAFVSVSAGYDHVCGATVDSAAYCWGFGNVGQLGNGSTIVYSATPVLVAGNHHFGQVSVGLNHSCGVTGSGEGYCWGTNTNGELGTGLLGGSSVPALVAGGHNFTLLSAGGGHSCGVAEGATAYCWGQNGWGQLGRGTTGPSGAVPDSQVLALMFAVANASHDGHSCGLEATSEAAYCWGDNTNGQLGIGAHDNGSHQTPELVTGAHHFKTVSGGYTHTCAIGTGIEDGIAFCWGANLSGQLGDNSMTQRDEPVRVAAPSSATRLLGASRSP
jgi:alpha-tubulin suppressor-like RCC1 family protein